MNMFQEEIVPYVGTNRFPLYAFYDQVSRMLSDMGIDYTEEIWGSDAETVPHPWKVMEIPNVLSLFFAKNDKLFKVVFWKNYAGNMANGIGVGMSMEQAFSVDKTLSYNDWDEIYESEKGYWLEENPLDKTVFSITVFIKEIDDGAFDEALW